MHNRINVGRNATVRQHDALRVAGGSTRVLQNRERLGVVEGAHIAQHPESFCCIAQFVDTQRGRISGLFIEEVCKLIIDQQHDCVTRVDPHACRIHKFIDRRQAHWQRQHHRGRATQPGCLDRGHEWARRGSEYRDVRSWSDTARLKYRGHGTRIVMEFAPSHRIHFARHRGRPDEGDRRVARGHRFNAGNEAAGLKANEVMRESRHDGSDLTRHRELHECHLLLRSNPTRRECRERIGFSALRHRRRMPLRRAQFRVCAARSQ